METLEKVRNLQRKGSDIHLHGLKGFSRYQTARLLGFSQIAQFDNPSSLRLDVGCWMLGELSEKAIKSQQEFIDTYIFPELKPGSITDIRTLKEVVEGSRVSDRLKEVIIDNLHLGKSIDDVKLSGIQKQNLKKALEVTGGKLKTKLGEGFSIEKLVSRLTHSLSILSPSAFIQIITEGSYDRTQRVLNGDVELESNEQATIYLSTLLPLSKLVQFEELVAEMLSEVESFRHNYYVLIKKLSPLIVDGSDPKKPPFWIRYFDHDNRAKAPSLTELVMVYTGVKRLGGESSEMIKEWLGEYYGENSRVRVFEFGKVLKLIQDKGLTLSEAHKEMRFTVDVAQFYRAYKAWTEGSRYTEYWKKNKL